MPFVPPREQRPTGFRGGHRLRRSRRPIKRLGVAGLLATVVAVTVATFSAGQAQAAGFSVGYAQTARWESGYTGTYTLTNTGAEAVDGWSLAFTLPAGARITSLWNGRADLAGRKVTVSNETWNGTLAPRQAVVVGFVADAAGTQQVPPEQCTINGKSCADAASGPKGSRSAAPDPTPSRRSGPEAGTAPVATPSDQASSSDGSGEDAAAAEDGSTPDDPSTAGDAASGGDPTAGESTNPGDDDAAGGDDGAPGGATPGGSAAPGRRPRTSPSDGTEFAPFVDALLYPAYDLAANAAATGVRRYTLGFVVAAGGCTPSWGASLPVEDPGITARVAALRAAGGDVRVSFGGANGTELATVCDDAENLAAAYQRAIDASAATHVDFDVEGAALADAAANRRRADAITILRRNAAAAGRPLDVSVTLPALPQGLTQAGVDLLAGARDAGVEFDSVDLLAMNYGADAAPNPAGQLGRFAIDAVTAAQAQVRGVFGLSDDDAWALLAVTPMVGVGDVAGEVFTVADARDVGRFARSKGLAWYAMWSASRDRACSGGPEATVGANCSGVDQRPADFTRAFLGAPARPTG